MRKLSKFIFLVLFGLLFLVSCNKSAPQQEPASKTYPVEENSIYFAAPLFNIMEMD